MKVSQEVRLEIIQEVVAGKLEQAEAAEKLGVTKRTIRRYKAKFIKQAAKPRGGIPRAK